jgi:hypothetical protein
MANDELYTPKWIFDSLAVTFDLDVCAPIGGPLHTPAKAWYSELDDGLSKDWFGRVWMNPPYSKPSPWIKKWLSHRNGFALVPAAKSQWFIDLWESEAVGLPLRVNMKFLKQDKPFSIYFLSTLWAIGETNITALKMSNLGRIR